MAFAQLTYRESLRDIETCLNAVQPKLYHAGFRGKVSRSTLTDANRRRDWRIYADFAQVLIRRARVLYAKDDFGVALKHAAYALDSTTIDLCLALFPWARFRRRKGAVKLHTLIDLRGNIPCFIRITHGKTADVNVLDHLPIEPGAFYMMDRGYIDFERLYAITRQMAFFVTRAKRNIDCSRRESRVVDKSTGLRSDQTIVLQGLKTSHLYPTPLRRMAYYDAEHEQATGIPDQQLRPFGTHHRTTLSVSLASGTILQVDQAELADQGVLRPLRQRREDPGVDCHQRLRVGGHPQEGVEDRPQPHRNPPNSERDSFRENPYFPGTFDVFHTEFRKPLAVTNCHYSIYNRTVVILARIFHHRLAGELVRRAFAENHRNFAANKFAG